MPISTGLSARQTFTVADDDTAAALGSGDLPVLGTPRLLAWCEATTCAALAEELTGAETSVGTRRRHRPLPRAATRSPRSTSCSCTA